MVLVLLDVNALYTSIPHQEAFRVIANVLDTRPILDPPTHFLLELLDLILEKKFFRCEDKFYIQHKGVAMGSAVAPSVANLFMTSMEHDFILSNSNPFLQNLHTYLCFIDNIFIVFKEETQLQDFFIWLNDLDPNINFSSNSNKMEISFLDTIVYRSQNNSLGVKPFRKPTDRNTFLRYDSFHPRHLRTGIPYSQFIQLKHNSTHKEDFLKECNILDHQFQERGYPNHIVARAKQRAMMTPRELFKNKPKATTDRLCNN